MSLIAPEIAMREYRQRTRDELARDAHSAAARLSIATRSWGTALPGEKALSEATFLAEGLGQALYELRACMAGNATVMG
jgi:hypothetical protein